MLKTNARRTIGINLDIKLDMESKDNKAEKTYARPNLRIETTRREVQRAGNTYSAI